MLDSVQKTLLRYLALNRPRIAMALRPFLSRECVYVARPAVAIAQRNQAAPCKYAENREARFVTGPAS